VYVFNLALISDFVSVESQVRMFSVTTIQYHVQ
jgi:hypothetical protein